MEELITQFPDKLKVEPSYRSFIYQPERISINSRQSLVNASLFGNQLQPEYYYQFENELRSPLLRIKRMELLRATIPNAVTSIPLSQGVFFYYRIPALNAPADYAPDYTGLVDVENIHMVRLLPQTAYDPDDYEDPNDTYAWNKTFQDYEDFVNELNKATKDDPDFNVPTWLPITAYPAGSYVFDDEQRYYTAAGSAGTATFNTDSAWVKVPTPFIPNDITFTFNETLNKIVVQGNNYYDDVNNIPKYYYLPVGYQDEYLLDFINFTTGQAAIEWTANTPYNARTWVIYQNVKWFSWAGSAGTAVFNTDNAWVNINSLNINQFPTNVPYTLNRRLGFVWSGVPLDFGEAYVINNLEQHTFPKPNWQGGMGGDYEKLLPYYTAEAYIDLVNTQNVFVYCDFVGGSTQDTNADERLLAVVPMNASNLGVAFGESKIVCPLSKVSENIYRILITLRTDTAEPFYLPTNAYVNLEIKIEYE